MSERRTAVIDVPSVAERVKTMEARRKWVNSHQQVLDGLTKQAARDGFGEVLARGTHQLKFDPTFTAAKKSNKGSFVRLH